jgi:hypothetical protein
LLLLPLACGGPEAVPSQDEAEAESDGEETDGSLSTGTGETGEEPPDYLMDLGTLEPETCQDIAPLLDEVEPYPEVGDLVANLVVTLPDGQAWELCNMYTSRFLLKLAAFW